MFYLCSCGDYMLRLDSRMSPLSMAGALVGDHMCYGITNISSACDDASYQLGQRGIMFMLSI
jgi:hypothetical protein